MDAGEARARVERRRESSTAARRAQAQLGHVCTATVRSMPTSDCTCDCEMHMWKTDATGRELSANQDQSLRRSPRRSSSSLTRRFGRGTDDATAPEYPLRVLFCDHSIGEIMPVAFQPQACARTSRAHRIVWASSCYELNISSCGSCIQVMINPFVNAVEQPNV